jgi:cobalamin biosynthesis protein CobD/CbiB
LRNIGLEATEMARDVGPSAGYFACLGLVSARLKRPWNWISGSILLLAFAIAIFMPPTTGESAKLKFSADLAHLLAFPLGWFSARLGREQQSVNQS